MTTVGLRATDLAGKDDDEIITIKQRLNEELGANFDLNDFGNIGSRWKLINYLNEHNFLQHEGKEINDETLTQFIYRIQRERDVGNMPNRTELQIPLRPYRINPLMNFESNDFRPNYDNAVNIAASSYTPQLSLPSVNINTAPLTNYTAKQQHSTESDLLRAITDEKPRKQKRKRKMVNRNENEILLNNKMNPLEQYIGNTVSVADLVDIYNRYCPVPLSMQEVRDNSQGDENVAKAHLLQEILKAAKEGYLAGRQGGGFGEKKGMQELKHIILDLQRDVKRVSNAISPQGAEKLVVKHNLINPKSPWQLNKINPNQPATLQNLTDVNNDGIPDVIISNKRGEPMYVNGYTTKRSDYPLTLNYYSKYPSRKDRVVSKKQYKQDLLQTKYVDSGVDPSLFGNVTYNENIPEFAGYNLDNYTVKEPKRLSAYQRFMKYIIGDVKDSVFDALAQQRGINIPNTLRLSVLAKAAAQIWNEEILTPFFQHYGVTSPDAQKKIKKARADEIDNRVSELIGEMNELNSPTWQRYATRLAEIIEGNLNEN